MTNRQEYSLQTFLGKYEILIREQLGKQLDDLYKQLHNIGKKCNIKLMNIPPSEKGITVNDLLQGSSEYRRQTVAAMLYNDALWRLEAAYLMLSIGLINIAYANLRESKEALVIAFIVQRVDTEAINFLEGKEVDKKLIANYINSDYNKRLKDMGDAFGKWGVHTNFESVQLTSLFGPSRFDKMVTESTKINKVLKLPDGFVDVASTCIERAGYLGLLFSWLMSKSVAS